jgi:hypothetical protein
MEYHGPPEPDYFNCEYCQKLILTLWSPNNQGMLSSKDFCLLGDSVWHHECFVESMQEHGFEFGGKYA